MAYTTLEEVRNVPPLSESVQRYPDEALTEGILWAESRIDEITGTAWGNGSGDYKSGVVAFDGTSGYNAYVDMPFMRSVEAVTLDGITVSTLGWNVYGAEGRITSGIAMTGYVEVTVKYGATKVVPPDISWCARTLARWYVLKLSSQTPDNAVNIVSEGGTVVLAQPGRTNPTALPEVNRILMERSHRYPSV